MAISDIMGQYLTNRVDQAIQPFSDPEAYLRQRLLDEEEERKKREREEAAKQLAEQQAEQQQAVEQAQQPTGQTAAPGQTVNQIPANMASPNQFGSAIAQGQTIEGPPPTQGGPAVPDQEAANIEEQRRLQQAQAQTAQLAQPAQPMAQPAPAAPQTAPAPQMSMDERIAAAAERARQRAAQGQTMTQPMAQPMAQPAPAPAPAVPVAPAVPASTPSSAMAVVPGDVMAQYGRPPVPGPGIQVASTEPGAGVAEVAKATQTVAPPPAEPEWITAANEAGNDFNKLVDVAAKFPESRAAIQAKLKSNYANIGKADEAQKIVEAAQNGDPKALNKLEQSLRPTRGKEKEEVTVGDYLKAYMYARLGLNELSQQVQNKIAGTDTQFGQVQLGGTNWKVETNRKTGEIIRAQDDEGNFATPNTLNKLSAAGQKFGTQAFSSTGGSQVIPAGQPNAGEEYRSVFNSTTGKFENQIITGPNAGKTYTGPAGVDKTVFTQQAKRDYEVISAYRQKFGTDKLAALDQARKDGIIKSPADERKFLETWNFGAGLPGFGQADREPQSTVRDTKTPPPEPTIITEKPVDTTKSDSSKITKTSSVSKTTTPAETTTTTTKVGGGGQPPVRDVNEPETVYKNRLEAWKTQNAANVQQAKELAVAEQKPPAEARGKLEAKDINNQNYADSTYGIIKPISDAIRKSTGSSLGAGADKLASAVGVGTQGAQNIAKLEVLGYQLLSNVPRFEGPQSDIDVQMYKQAAGDLANSSKPVSVRLAALDSIVMMLKKYDKSGTNDWSFGSGSNIKIIKREKVQ